MRNILTLISQLLFIFVMFFLASSGADIRWLLYIGFIYLGIAINSKE